MRSTKTAISIILAALFLLLLVIAIGLIYVWWTGHLGSNEVPAVAGLSSQRSNALPTPGKRAANSPVSAAVQSLTSPVTPGSNASIEVRTVADATCKIAVKLKDRETTIKDSGLVPKVADEYGMVSWAWTVPSSAKTGAWQVIVTCQQGKKSAMVIGDLAVKSRL